MRDAARAAHMGSPLSMGTSSAPAEISFQETITLVGNKDMLRSIKISMVVQRDALLLSTRPEHQQSIQGREDCTVRAAEGQHYWRSRVRPDPDSRYFIRQGVLRAGSVHEFFRLLVAFALYELKEGGEWDEILDECVSEVERCKMCGSQRNHDSGVDIGPSLKCINCEKYSWKDLVDAFCHQVKFRATLTDHPTKEDDELSGGQAEEANVREPRVLG